MADKCAVCGYFADSGRHDTVETCDAVRGPCLDPASHHPFVSSTPAPDLLAAAPCDHDFPTRDSRCMGCGTPLTMYGCPDLLAAARAVVEANDRWSEDSDNVSKALAVDVAITALRAAIEEGDRG